MRTTRSGGGGVWWPLCPCSTCERSLSRAMVCFGRRMVLLELCVCVAVRGAHTFCVCATCTLLSSSEQSAQHASFLGAVRM